MEELKTFVDSLAKVIDVIGERLVNQHEQTVKLIDLMNELNMAMVNIAKRVDDLERKVNNEM